MKVKISSGKTECTPGKTGKFGYENELYWGEIRDEYGDVESGTICETFMELYKWADEHNFKDIYF